MNFRPLLSTVFAILLWSAGPASADPVSEAKAWLVAGKPLVFTMSKTIGTLHAGEHYLVGYKHDSASGTEYFDTQGPSGGSTYFNLSRYTNASLQGSATSISMWGVVEYLIERNGELVLYPIPNPDLSKNDPDAVAAMTTSAAQTLADADAQYQKKLGLQPVHACAGLTGDDYLKCYYTIAVPAYCKSAMDCIDANGPPTCTGNMCSVPDRCSALHGPTYSNRLLQAVAADLEAYAKYHLFAYRKETWNENAAVMASLYDYVHEAIDTSVPYGFRSSYACDNGVTGADPQTPAYMIRALYAYWKATGSPAAYADFIDLSGRWLADFEADPQLGLSNKPAVYPNDRGTLTWVIARRLAESLEQQSIVATLCTPVLMQGLFEQYTTPSQFLCSGHVPRGFGGWSHASASALQPVATTSNCQPFETPQPQVGSVCSLCPDGTNHCLSSGAQGFAGDYKQWMGYHLMVIQGFSELYRVIQAQGNTQCNAFSSNFPYNAMASIAWIYGLRTVSVFSDPGSMILDRYTNPCVDGPINADNSYGAYGTTSGLAALYETKRSFDVSGYMPYQTGFGPAPAFSYSDLEAMIADTIRFNDKHFLDSVLYFGDRLQYEFPTLRPSLF